MIQSLETEAQSGNSLNIQDIRAMPIKDCKYGDNKGLVAYDLPEYSCDSVCDNCHCATY